jgi:hypothetical protein
MNSFWAATSRLVSGVRQKSLAVLGTFALYTTAITAAAVSSPGSAAANPGGGTVTVQFGRPTKLQRLEYTDLYEKKPFPDAVLLYYDNGMYAILSEGENHYGTYVMQGSFTDTTFTVNFISLPSEDWSGTSVLHTLVFDTNAGTFTQQLTNPLDPGVPKQTGHFTTADNHIADPTLLTWQSAQDLGR